MTGLDSSVQQVESERLYDITEAVCDNRNRSWLRGLTVIGNFPELFQVRLTDKRHSYRLEMNGISMRR